MAEPFIGQVMLFAGNFAPQGWAFCDGSLLSISQYTALFSLLGTYYGGNGVQNFALPDLRGRVPVGMGAGPGLANVIIGEQYGSASVTLLTTNLPNHTHPFASPVSSAVASVSDPTGAVPAQQSTGSGRGATSVNAYAPTATGTGLTGTTGSAGGNQPISVSQPSLGMNYIIALTGVYPPRS